MLRQVSPKRILSIFAKRNAEDVRWSITFQLLCLTLSIILPLILPLIYLKYEKTTEEIAHASKSSLNLLGITAGSTEQFVVDHQAFISLVAHSVTLPPISVITMVNDAGIIVARATVSDSLTGKDGHGIELVDTVLAQSSGYVRTKGLDGIERIFGITSIAEAGWNVYVGVPTEIVLANEYTEFICNSLIEIGIVLTALILALYLGHRISHPMRDLAQAVHAVKQGQFEACAPIAGPLEVAQVAAEFNQMLDVRSQLNMERGEVEAKLARREELFRAMIENSLDGIVLLSAEGIVTYVSPAAARIFGYRDGEAIGKNRTDLIHPDDRERVDQQWFSTLQQPGAISKNEFRVRHKDDSWLWTEHILHNLLLNPAVGAVVSNYRDITERKQAEDALRRYATRLEIQHDIDESILAAHSLEDITMAVLNRVSYLVTSQEAHITLYNFEENHVSVYARIPHSEPDLITGMQIPLEQLGEITDILDSLRRGEVLVTDKLTDRMPDSPIIQTWLASAHQTVIIAPLREQGQLIGTLSLSAEGSVQYNAEDIKIVQEVADSLAVAIVEVRLFEKVSAGRYRLRLLSQQLIEAQEDASRRIARELHDEVGTNLTALGINLYVLKSEMSDDASKALETRVNDSLILLDEAQDRIRSVQTDLHPAVLDDYGLEAALRWYAEQFSDRAGVEVNVYSTTLSSRLSSELETVLFRITQEALTNVAKHAQATHVNITLEQTEGVIRLIVADDGIGFNPSEQHKPNKQGGLGLNSMAERAALVEGHLRVESLPGEGTRVLVEINSQLSDEHA